MASRKPHPSDIWSENVIAEAVEFTAFCQGGGRITQRFDNRTDAEAAAQRLADQYRRTALVYGISAEGRSALAATIHPSKETPMVTIKTNLAPIQIARLTAIIDGGKVQRSLTKEAAVNRFLKTAADHNVANAVDVLAMGIDAAKSALGFDHNQHVDPAGEARKPKPVKAKTAEASSEIPKMTGPVSADGAVAVAKPKATSTGKRAAAIEAAQRGEIPQAPDFSAATHKPHRAKLAKIIEMVEAGDVDGLRAMEIKPTSSSPKAMLKFRDLAVIALEAKANAA
ncbi:MULTISPECIES: hypothetical protein [unclassified Chelatococcus]|uniref:hypothetical protein n=1 Tax=unclassified Chelatococcus TaxID=2638111 RepID=UPI001BD1B177|nr:MULTISPECIES: hypothetical protein [unclassified Chelatococcus]CAH1672367.1 conserved hypothetical protein [Hyphomicrobiales bacterium]MBS7738957.1 hypothetical protein [Chelatococcus sp. HY11]MBX3543390.1 hypothetical protein [Chelatococcus sp.]MCO5076513.1 hypothetical protein [Chelatococcus sp.]CAH1675408.1 conserved hypothetical protein [Hyphomicrobiales bacterium]